MSLDRVHQLSMEGIDVLDGSLKDLSLNNKWKIFETVIFSLEILKSSKEIERISKQYACHLRWPLFPRHRRDDGLEPAILQVPGKLPVLPNDPLSRHD